VLAAIPVSLVGGVAAVLVAGAELTLGSVIGLLAVLAIATRTSLLMVTTLQSLQRDTPDAARSELAQRAARERLAPVITTAVALAMLALPFVVLGPRAGLEILHPMAQVLVGGLVTVVLVTLLLVPTLCLAGRRGAQGAEGDQTEPGPVGEPSAASSRSSS
jgi:Cu/Ag efflux pump CusA